MTTDHGWLSYGPGDNSHLTDERQFVEVRMREREEARGRLLAVVQVRVYENDAEPGVAFPQGAVLGVNSEQADFARAVARARVALGDWR